MKKILPILSVLLLIAGCSGYKSFVAKINTPPAGCEDSVVYELIPQPSVTMLLSVVPYKDLIHNEGYLEWAKKINLLALDLLKNDEITYGRFAIAILAESTIANQWWGSTLVTVSDILSGLIVTGGNRKITDCDRTWLRTWAINALASHTSFFDDSTRQDSDGESESRICGWKIPARGIG
jgi:hypothetical protein